jgi:hypothetical protein
MFSRAGETFEDVRRGKDLSRDSELVGSRVCRVLVSEGDAGE